MNLRIDPTSGRPVYQQLVWQVKRAVACDDLRPGERLPSVRDLAAELLINPNTIAKAYREMEREGLIYTRPGKGVFVRADRGVELTEQARKRILTDLIEQVIVESRHLGLPADQLRTLFSGLVDGFDEAAADSGRGVADRPARSGDVT